MATIIDNININQKEVPIVFEKSDQLPIFNLQLVFKNSGYILDKTKPGITTLTSKILNEGTKKDGSIKFSQKLENKAISLNASNGFETFVIEISCLQSEYLDALKLLDELLKDPNITEDSLEKIKIMQISKIKQKEDDFDSVASKNLNKIIWKNTSLENGKNGDVKSISKIKLNDIKQHLEDIINLNNLVIVVGGKIELDTFKNDISKILKSFKSKQVNENKRFTVSKNIAENRLIKNTEQAYIYFGSDFNLEHNSSDVYKAKVASFILGGSGFGSRLMEEIRVKNGLAYSVYGHIGLNSYYSCFTGYLQTKIENEKKAKMLVIKTISDFVENGATKEELNSAKQFLTGSEPLRTETFSQRLGLAFNLFYKNLPQDYPKKELELINNLTLEELNNFIKSHKEILELSFSIVTK